MTLSLHIVHRVLYFKLFHFILSLPKDEPVEG